MTKSREPLIRVVGREELGARAKFALRAGSFLFALIFGGLFILAIGYNPIEIYSAFISGSFRSAMAVQSLVKIMIPMIIASLGVTVAFKMRFWNIGAEGQITIGATFATYFALYHSGWNHWALIIVMILAGAVGGALWGLIPAVCRTRWSTNETLFTLMLNYIAQSIVAYFRDGSWRDPNAAGFSKIARFDTNAQLDKVFGVHFGWVIAVILVLAVFVYLKYTKQGYEISVVGESVETARYAGMNVKKITIRTMMISGAICGVCGMIQATGADATLTTAVAGGVGFTAIIIAWLAKLDPFGIVLISFLFGILEKGSSVVQSSFGLSADSADVLQGIILFLFLACELFVRYKFVFRKSSDNQSAAKAATTEGD